MELDTSEKRDAYRVAHLHLFDRYLAEKVAIVTLVCVNFAEMLPWTTARPPQVVVAVGVLVVINSFLGLAFARHRWSAENMALQFAVLVSINLGLVWFARAVTPRFNPNNAMFFVLLISLIVLLYDRYRPVRDLRWTDSAAEIPAHPKSSD